MMVNEHSPTLLTLCIFILLFIGLAIFTWGKKLPAKGIWLGWAGILALLTGIGFDGGIFLKEEFKTKVWMSGWVWPRREMGAITVGVFQDPLSLAMSALAAGVIAALFMQNSFISREPHPERAYAALAISGAGVALAWNSLTPWLAFAGLALTMIGGFIALGSRWDSNAEASVAGRFIWERAAGFLFAFFGACVLATSRTALLLHQPEVWTFQTGNLNSTWIGSMLLFAGLFIQIQPFPFLGWLVSGSEIYPPLRILLNQLFPAWAAFPLLLRLHSHFTSLGLFPELGWVALVSSVLAVLMGLFQSQWRLGQGAWVASGLSLTWALLAFSGPFSAMAMLVGVSLAALCLSAGATALEEKRAHNSVSYSKAIWIKTALFLGTAAGTGFIGFVSATGGLQWIVQAISLPGIVALFLFVFFLYVLLGWKLTWNILKCQSTSDVPWVFIFSLFIWLLLSLAVVWTGTASGEILLGDPDRLIGSIFDLFFGANAREFKDPAGYISASGLYWGCLILAFATAYWTAGRKEDQWVTLSELFPRSSKFLAQGYGVDILTRRMMGGVIWFGKSAETLIDEKIWMGWIPKGLYQGIKTVSGAVSEVDSKISLMLGAMLRRVVEVPAKILQLIQTGDVRWYLFFALGSGFALLSHFLKR